MIDPTAVSTVRVGELSPEPFSLTDNVPHEVGTELKRGTIEDLATFISAFIGSTDGVGFRAISVTDGQTLPTTTQQEFILVGKGTYYNVVGGSTIICTEELNAIVSNGSYWFIGVEIPINVELAGITQFIRDGFVNTTPSEDVIYEALALKANVSDSEDVTNKVSEITEYSTTLYPNEKATHDALDLKLNISDLPTNLTLYPTTTTSDVSGYVVMAKDIHDVRYNSTAVDVSTPTITTTEQLVASLITDAGVLIGQPGVFNATTFGNIRRLSGSGTATFYFKIFHRDLAGTETLIGTSSVTEVVASSSYLEFTGALLWNDGDFIDTDRIVIKYYANRVPGSSDPVYQFQFGGASPVRTLLPVPFSVVDAGYELRANKQNDLTPDGTGTKYPTVDAVNAIDLQKVLDVNGFAELASGGGNVGIYYFNEEGEDTGVFNVNLTDSISSSNSSINIVKGSIDIESSNSLESSRIQITPSTFNLSKRSLVDGDFNTNVTLSTPVENTTLNFPAKTVAGTYTLATTDETVNLTGDQTIEGNKQFTDNLSVDFNILLLNTDGDGYGEIQNSLNRFTFINQFGNIQFLMQNSGFVTYKSPTISGTFSNANLTANRTFTLPDATGTIPIVSQTITNGVTDKSPSEDAVFDALANVSRNIILDATPSTAVTSTLTETIFKSYFLPANTFSSSTLIKIPSFLISKTGTAGTAIIKIYFNSTNTLSGATQIATYTIAGTTTYVTINRTFILTSGTIKGFSFISGGSLTDVTTAGNGFSSAAFDTTTDKYIITSCTLSNSADSVSQFSFNLVN